MDPKIKNEILSVLPQITELRHRIHKEPELSFEEYKTAELVKTVLDQAGIPYRDKIAGTGILAEIDGERHGDKKTLLIRADMDALPITEESGLEFSSREPCVMHACGHDIHTSVLLGCALVLDKLKPELCGTIKLMFQPGEETSGGAKPMIDAGILDDPKVDSAVALHVEPSLNVGEAGFKAGAAYSCPDEFFIKIKGRGGHAAYPHKCVDPIVISAEIITELQTIASRMSDPLSPVVVSVCAVEAGTTYNVIPDEAVLRGTARSFSNKDRDMLENKIEAVVSSVCGLYGAEYEYNFDRLFPPLINDADTIKELKSVALRVLDADKIYDTANPTMAGEDFAYLTQEVEHSALFWLGSTPEGRKKYPLHSAKFVASDDCIKYGIGIFCEYALKFLSPNI